MKRTRWISAYLLLFALVSALGLDLTAAQSRDASDKKSAVGATRRTSSASRLSASRVSQGQRAVGIRGFAAGRVAGQRELEAKLKQLPAGESAEKHLRFLTAEPHLAGTPGSKRVAEYVRDQLRSYGFEAELVRYDVWLPHPKEVKLELVAPERIELARPEEAIEGDPSSEDVRAVMGYNGYAPSAEVIAPVVYANYGLPEDYERLRDAGVSVKGKLVLVRYGRTFRGVKTYVAEENKAAGVIIFSDPADDGYVVGDPYPRGPWRPMSGIQRGSVYYGFLTPGDPLTPGVAATADAPRLEPREARTLPQIPTMPISARDAEEILKRMNGPRVPRSWQGGLPFTYHMGGGNTVRVRMKLDMDYQQRAIWNAVGKLRGTNADEWVVAGNHHDAWVFGAVDPSSGTAAVLEMARSLGALVKAGWKPRRSIVVCAWDAEEFGLIGSTEWVEHRVEELRQKAVAYVNVDAAVSGDRFGASGTPSLKGLLREVAREVNDPRTGRSIYE
ncbi:MAG: M28 family peptidase, partial [Candidatus Acidiferrales bacterium]